jgi:hypothetical protein
VPDRIHPLSWWRLNLKFHVICKPHRRIVNVCWQLINLPNLMTTRLAFFNWLRKANGEFNARSNDTWMGLSINVFFYNNQNPQIWKQNDVTIETFQRKFNVFLLWMEVVRNCSSSRDFS